MKVKFYADGIKIGPIVIRRGFGLCAPRRRTHAFLFAYGNERLSLQVWRAYAWLEVFTDRQGSRE